MSNSSEGNAQSFVRQPVGETFHSTRVFVAPSCHSPLMGTIVKEFSDFLVTTGAIMTAKYREALSETILGLRNGQIILYSQQKALKGKKLFVNFKLDFYDEN